MKKHESGGMGYGRFLSMIVTSTVAMFGLMYLNTYAMDHVFFSQTRMWMALYMGGVMAIIMLAFMLGMYSNRKVNLAILRVQLSRLEPGSGWFARRPP